MTDLSQEPETQIYLFPLYSFMFFVNSVMDMYFPQNQFLLCLLFCHIFMFKIIKHFFILKKHNLVIYTHQFSTDDFIT